MFWPFCTFLKLLDLGWATIHWRLRHATESIFPLSTSGTGNVVFVRYQRHWIALSSDGGSLLHMMLVSSQECSIHKVSQQRIIYISESIRSTTTGWKPGPRTGSFDLPHTWRPIAWLVAFTIIISLVPGVGWMVPVALEEGEATFACSQGCRTAPCAYKRPCIRLPGRSVTQGRTLCTCWRRGEVAVFSTLEGTWTAQEIQHGLWSRCI